MSTAVLGFIAALAAAQAPPAEAPPVAAPPAEAPPVEPPPVVAPPAETPPAEPPPVVAPPAETPPAEPSPVAAPPAETPPVAEPAGPSAAPIGTSGDEVPNAFATPEPAPLVEQRPEAPRAAAGLERTGLYHWGLGLELPMVGLDTGLGQRSRVGVGYTLGAAVSWEVTPKWLARLYGNYRATYAARSPVSYVVGLRELRDQQPSEWVGAELGLGGAYVFRELDREWNPYVGADAGVRFSGFFYDFDDEHQLLRAIDYGDALARCTDAACRNVRNDGLALGAMFTVRGGVRLELFDWLATLAELSVSYQPIGEELVSNTLTARDVLTVPEDLLHVALTLSARLGL